MSGFSPPPLTEDRYPEHTKLVNLKDKTETVNDFVEWLRENHDGVYLAREIEGGDFRMVPLSKHEYDTLLAGWMGIDLKVISKEKDWMVQDMREANT